MIIQKGDKFRFHLSKWNDKKKVMERVYQDNKIYDNWQECQKVACKTAIDMQLYYGIEKVEE